MTRRGQGAMEYLMSYGWAILVVMAVGVAMWRLGVLTPSGGLAPTQNGFQAIRPLLPSCDMANNLYGAQYLDGFYCNFVNAAGTTIRVTDMAHSVDGKACQVIAIFTPTVPNTYWNEWATDDLGTDWGFTSWPCLGSGTSDTPACYLPVEKDQVFSMYIFSWEPGHNGATSIPHGPCIQVKRGVPYNVFIGITYLINVGGVESTKVSSGTIRLSGT